MKYQLESTVVLTLELSKSGSSNLIGTDFNLSVSKNLDISKYLDNEGLPTQEGSKAITTVLVHGLVGNIHQCHENGFRDSAEHLRHIISELERGFVAITEVQKSNFNRL